MTLPSRDLSNDVCTATVLDQGAQLIEWTPTGLMPVMWLSDEAVFSSGIAVRGGVPVVFPWFGAGRRGDLRPSHGFARISDWTLTECHQDAERSSATYTLGTSCEEFPFAYLATLHIEVSSILRISLEVRNLDAQSFSFEEALHAYLHVGDVTRISIEGLEGSTYHDKVRAKEGEVQQGVLQLDGETDRVYVSSDRIVIHDPELHRRLLIAKAGSANTVVWNPWSHGAEALSDMPDDAWRSMVCVEAGNIGENAITLQPGEAHVLEYSLYPE